MIKAGLEGLAQDAKKVPSGAATIPQAPVLPAISADEQPVVIVHLFPDLLNLYGDGGNVKVLESRLKWRGIPVQVRRVHLGEDVDLSQADLVFLGGGPDREQKLASEKLLDMRDDLAQFIDDDGALLAICGGYQIMGDSWLLGDESVPGLRVAGLDTRRAGTSRDRLVDNIGLRVPGIQAPVVGYENHAGRTYLNDDVEPFGAVISSTGHGNNDDSHADGVRFRHVVGTYLHGPLLGKNPEVADLLLGWALEHREKRCKVPVPAMIQLDDAIESQANTFMAKRIGAV